MPYYKDGIDIFEEEDENVPRGTFSEVRYYIEEIHSVKKIQNDSTSYIKVDVTVSCDGNISRISTSFNTWEEWEDAKYLGYYLG